MSGRDEEGKEEEKAEGWGAGDDIACYIKENRDVCYPSAHTDEV